MSQHQIVSMLNFLRTGVFGSLQCGMPASQFLQLFGKPEWRETSSADANISYFGLGCLEVWFHKDTHLIHRIKLKPRMFEPYFHSRKSSIPRVKFDQWVLRDGMNSRTVMQFLKSAQITHTSWNWANAPVEQIDLASGVCLLCDSSASPTPGLGQIESSNIQSKGI
jgi:hypothetical protein